MLAISKQNSAVKQLDRSRRQVILMRLIETMRGKGLDPTFPELAKEMRKNPWVKEHWPSLAAETVRRDFLVLMDMDRDIVEQLAMPYLVKQINTLDAVMGELSEMVHDADQPVEIKIKAAQVLGSYVDRSIKVFGNYAPKEMHIKKATLHGSLDDFMKLKEQARKELMHSVNGDLVDGEVIEESEGVEN